MLQRNLVKPMAHKFSLLSDMHSHYRTLLITARAGGFRQQTKNADPATSAARIRAGGEAIASVARVAQTAQTLALLGSIPPLVLAAITLYPIVEKLKSTGREDLLLPVIGAAILVDVALLLSIRAAAKAATESAAKEAVSAMEALATEIKLAAQAGEGELKYDLEIAAASADAFAKDIQRVMTSATIRKEFPNEKEERPATQLDKAKQVAELVLKATRVAGQATMAALPIGLATDPPAAIQGAGAKEATVKTNATPKSDE
eukprot:gnl/MRDRNA2_/MRDRNA2_65436_c0_seq1.p1 gnl/MRDRNA2_/MRDRNA2_65436_c0~~gnl/MRDRNA2_/MRDRNA2_65436_c0_seq1.p1  ORF type:complete len:260 (+),score=56.42 gnl/MRDRNA2_/MRDRNA2_65436_c0_seq1:236-1015(+)